MRLGWLYISLCGRLSPKPFADGFWRLASIDIMVHSLASNFVGHWSEHWAFLLYEVAAAWPLFALTAKRLQDNGRSLSLATLAAVALPVADAIVLACDYGMLHSRLPAALIFCIWTWLMWRIYSLPRYSGINRFGPPQGDLSGAESSFQNQSQDESIEASKAIATGPTN